MQFAAVFCDWPLPTQLPRCGKSFSFILEYMIYATYIALYIYASLLVDEQLTTKKNILFSLLSWMYVLTIYGASLDL